MSHNYPFIKDLLPHGSSMVLLDQIEKFDGDTIICIKNSSDDCLGSCEYLDSYWGIEMMAQACGLLLALKHLQTSNHDRKQSGRLVLCKNLFIKCHLLPRKTTLTVQAVLEMEGSIGLNLFDCSLCVGEDVYLRGNLSLLIT